MTIPTEGLSAGEWLLLIGGIVGGLVTVIGALTTAVVTIGAAKTIRKTSDKQDLMEEEQSKIHTAVNSNHQAALAQIKSLQDQLKEERGGAPSAPATTSAALPAASTGEAP